MQNEQRKAIFQCETEGKFAGIAAARYIYINHDSNDNEFKRNRGKAQRLAVIHSIVRFKYITPASIHVLCCHKSKSSTSNFIKRMMNEKLIRRLTTKWPEHPYIYALDYKNAIKYFEENTKNTLDDFVLDGKFDSSRYNLTESVRHMNYVQQFAIDQAQAGHGFLTELELKKLLTGKIPNQKYPDLIVKRKDDSILFEAIEIEIAKKSEKQHLYALYKAHQLLESKCVQKVTWFVDGDDQCDRFNFDLNHADNLPVYDYFEYENGKVGRKLEHKFDAGVHAYFTPNYWQEVHILPYSNYKSYTKKIQEITDDMLFDD